MGLIEDFLARYKREYEFYDQAARLAANRLEVNLRTAGIRSIVTSRAKSPSRLEVKCRQRNETKSYANVDEIFEDIVDLAGIRVALYFPGERDQVDKIVDRLFRLLEPKKEFPRPPEATSRQKRFSGYSAVHYRALLRDHELADTEARYSAARLEIQVASVLMHAWAEVEHDLVYKPFEGELSDAEYAILDQLNGLVIAGEIALEQLQRAGETRVAESGRRFANHYELAAHLISQVDSLSDGPIGDTGLGRVDHLFALLVKLKIDTPELLAPYIRTLHGDVERRPLAEQIIDALLEEDTGRYQEYLNIQAEERAAYGSQPADDSHALIGKFVTSWIELENLLRTLSQDTPLSRRTGVIGLARRLPIFDDRILSDLERLARIRNYLVHGIEMLFPADLKAVTEDLRDLISDIRWRAENPEEL
ncbi:RelA/SpoT domain-containing protein [Frankia sp. CiP3]|uniref:RelA/SpoT domain-containing protein n=1 Tax=Frankia sp. CiP3 TaxID=2880971 RepID=UPI001EF52BA7|nr:RelA/SpoT domain-containing protein [Frankia sp. CiP3]